MLDHIVIYLFVAVAAIFGGGVAIAWALRMSDLHWSWSVVAIPVGLLVWLMSPILAIALLCASYRGARIGARWHREDLAQGAEQARIAAERVGPLQALRRLSERRQLKERIQRGAWISGRWLLLGIDRLGKSAWMPIGGESGSHTLSLGASGAGKTISETWITARLIEAGHSSLVFDPKGDRTLEAELRITAQERGVPFLIWTPEGPTPYNPYARGSDSEIADKVLAGEIFTEPHYQRQAQRYLGHVVKALRVSGQVISAATLMANMDPAELEVTARSLPQDQAEQLLRYLDCLGERQRRELSGVRDRLSILAESDVGRWLERVDDEQMIELDRAIEDNAVVYFRLDSDRRPLVSQMLAGAIISDLIALTAKRQRDPIETVVVIDEFAALAAGHVSRLFGAARSAAISLILTTQELADLNSSANPALHDQVLGNISAMLAHRQNIPASAELIAAMAGTRETWITTQQTGEGAFSDAPSGQGSRRRGHEFVIHPSEIKTLQVGEAVLIAPGSGQAPTIVTVNHPRKARR